MRVLRGLGIAVVLGLIGVAGVAAALLTCALLGGLVTPSYIMPAYVVAFAFAYCAVPAMVLAWLAFGGVHLVLRLWPRSRHLQQAFARMDGALRRLVSRAPVGATASVGVSVSATMPAPQPPSLKVLGVLVAVPLAFLNLPGWLALQMNLVEGPLAAAALFVVPGVVCGLMIGALAERLRR